MKIAYNSCFGGFSLSSVALTEFAKSKGVALVWYEQVGYRHNGDEKYTRVEGVPAGSSMSLIPLTLDAGEVICKIPNDLFYYPNFSDDKMRCDIDLINVIELLGDKASGMCASLSIAEIPDGAEYEITEHDGLESVKPPRMSW